MTKFTTKDNDSPEYSNKDYAFANWVLNDIKRNQRLPLNITQQDVFDAIRNNSMWWYNEYPDATQDDFLYFSTDALTAPKDDLPEELKMHLTTYSVLMPDAVLSVFNCFYSSTGFANRASWAFSKWQLEAILFNSYQGLTTGYGVDTYMASTYATNLMGSLGKEPVAMHYNQDTHVLQAFDFHPKNMYGWISCEVARMLPISTFYSNDMYRKWIMAHVIQARCDQLELFGAQLPGELQLNVGVLRDRAQKFEDFVKEQVEQFKGADFYIIKS